MNEPGTTEPIIENVISGTWKYIGNHYMPYVVVYICVSVALAFFLPIKFCLIEVVLVGMLGYSVAYSKVKTEFTQQFGQSIGFSYEKNADLDTVSGKLFQSGHSQCIFDVLSGVYQNFPMRIFSFRFTIDSGKNSHTYSYTVFEATLKGTVPDILLFSKTHAGVASDWFGNDETIEMEGDFNKYFRLRVPKGYEQEAYQIFTPDVMVDLIDKASGLSFEFVGNKLYIYATKVVLKRTEMQSMFDLSEYLIGLFEKNTADMEVAK